MIVITVIFLAMINQIEKKISEEEDSAGAQY